MNGSPALYVSLERVCEHVTIARYHPSGGGFDTPYSFFVYVVLRPDGKWWFKTARGKYSFAVARALRQRLSAAGFPRVSRQSGYGARERVITIEALPANGKVRASPTESRAARFEAS